MPAVLSGQARGILHAARVLALRLSWHTGFAFFSAAPAFLIVARVWAQESANKYSLHFLCHTYRYHRSVRLKEWLELKWNGTTVKLKNKTATSEQNSYINWKIQGSTTEKTYGYKDHCAAPGRRNSRLWESCVSDRGVFTRHQLRSEASAHTTHTTLVHPSTEEKAVSTGTVTVEHKFSLWPVSG